MATLSYLIAYLAIAVFVIALVARFLMWTRLPSGVRWELYPVAHEAEKAHYGGSYLEESDWWKKPREVSLVAELKVMLPEIFFLVAMKEHNPKMWLRSFPFHFGLYLTAGSAAVMFGRAVLGAILPFMVSGWFGSFLGFIATACAITGLGLALLGALGLLQRRMTNPNLKDFTTKADLFNLKFFIVAFGLTLLHILFVDRDMSRAMFFIDNLVTFNMATPVGPAVWFTAITVILLGGLLAYIPLTHMSHFVGKYFAYHAIRWNDAPNLAGGTQEPKIKEVLDYPVSWSAEHIKGDGKKTWVDVATELPEK